MILLLYETLAPPYLAYKMNRSIHLKKNTMELGKLKRRAGTMIKRVE